MSGCLPTWLYRGLYESKVFEGLSKNDLNKLELDGWRDCQIKAREYHYEHEFDEQRKNSKNLVGIPEWKRVKNAKR